MTAPPDCTILDKYPPSAGNTLLGGLPPPLLHDDQTIPLLQNWYTGLMLLVVQLYPFMHL
jgi:hypothetical protein